MIYKCVITKHNYYEVLWLTQEQIEEYRFVGYTVRVIETKTGA